MGPTLAERILGFLRAQSEPVTIAEINEHGKFGNERRVAAAVEVMSRGDDSFLYGARRGGGDFGPFEYAVIPRPSCSQPHEASPYGVYPKPSTKVVYEFETVVCREELRHAQWIGRMPSIETAEQILARMANEGWEFCGLTPGRDHPVAEHRRFPCYMFKRAR